MTLKAFVDAADHRQILDTVASKNILMVVANPSVNPALGWPLGFWAAELMHPYFEFTEAGFEVTIASPDGGKAVRTFFEAKKITAVFCHGVAALLDCKLSDDSYLVKDKTLTGFANIEEEFSDAFVGQQVMPWRLEDALRERGANYVMGGRFKAFCVRDGQLITGQQQSSSRKVAQMVISALGM